MRKLAFILAAGSLAFSATSAEAANSHGPWQFYGGMDYQYLSASYKSPLDQVLPKTFNVGADIHVGAQYGHYFGFELGFMQSENNRDVVISTIPISSKVTIQGPTFDLLGFIPFGNSGVSAIGSIGVSDLTGKTNVASMIASVSASKTEFGYRGGAGIEWRPSYNFGIRVMARYQSADFDSAAKHAIVGTVGFNFYL